MASPGFNHPAFQQGGGSTAYSTPTTPPVAGTAYPATVDAATDARLEGAYAAPSAGAYDTGRMTVEDTVVKTALLFAVLLVTAAVGWFFSLGGTLVPAQAQVLSYGPVAIGAIGGLVLGLVNAFKKSPSVPLIVAYAAFEGLFVGGISAVFEFQWAGIVVQATLATFAVVAVTLALFASGKVRASARGAKILLIAMGGYLLFSLLNIVLTWTGVVDGWGLRSGWIGVVVGILVVVMAAYSLVLDFDQIQQGVRNGAPRKFAWQGAFGIMVTVVWLYVEILRILAILRGNN